MLLRIQNIVLSSVEKGHSLTALTRRGTSVDTYSESLLEEHARLDFSDFFATLLADFQPARLINLKNISSLLVYSVLPA